MKYILKIFKIFFVLIFILLILLNLILLFSKFVLKKEYPDILGYSYFEVLTGSMRNEINISDIVIVKSQANYQVGDIITYKSKNYVVTHRVVKVEENILVTKGDANNISDEPIYKNQVIGKVVHKIEKAGIYIKVFTDIKVIILMFIIIMLIVFIMSEIEMGNNYSEKIIFKNFILFICFLIMIGSIVTLARYVSKIYGIGVARAALFGSSMRLELNKIKGKPGDKTIIPIEVTNVKDGKVSEVSQQFTMYINRKYGKNLPIIIQLYKDKECNQLIYVNEDKVYTDVDFKFEASKSQVKTYYLKIEWPNNFSDKDYAFEIEYMSIDFRVVQVD